MFAEQLATLDLTAAHAGILRAIAAESGRSQHDLSAYLGVVPARLVGYLDELEERGYLERRRNCADRRRNALYITAEGKKLLRRVVGLARQHDDQLGAALGPENTCVLLDLLTTVARHQGLTPYVHPGYGALDRWMAQSRP
ncbi:MarR family winged helix-turn-helix transcriptional regulator [Mycobacterium branderi]|uniref:HTH marR-type domain-containing protein n=1 Tax=Mycobacterium branderi TaxID=43348 RepID=A0ABM7KPH5_9MYCO|nr:MarR family winged helix-turn-helix transcriptional regulator [Mycobacterium branderi]BBZ12975.1 hypothetical protein MBRA_31700 [Mycobacterium branderi]